MLISFVEEHLSTVGAVVVFEDFGSMRKYVPCCPVQFVGNWKNQDSEGERMSSWWFWVAGPVVLVYALFLIHWKIQIGVAHAVLVVAAVLIFLFPNLNLKIGADGSVEVKLETLNVATQGTLEAIDALQKRLDNTAQATESRLSKLERSSTSPTSPDMKSQLPSIANPPGIFVPAIDDNQKWRDILKGGEGWIDGPMALPATKLQEK